jgi:hypothetical protein
VSQAEAIKRTLFAEEAADVLLEDETRHLRRLRQTYRRQGTPIRR